MFTQDDQIRISEFIENLEIKEDSREYHALMKIQSLPEAQLEQTLIYLAYGQLDLDTLIALGDINEYSIKLFFKSFDPDTESKLALKIQYNTDYGFNKYLSESLVSPVTYLNKVMSVNSNIYIKFEPTKISANYFAFLAYYSSTMGNWMSLTSQLENIFVKMVFLKETYNIDLVVMYRELADILVTPHFLDLSFNTKLQYKENSFLWTMLSDISDRRDIDRSVSIKALEKYIGLLIANLDTPKIENSSFLNQLASSGWGSLTSDNFFMKFSDLVSTRFLIPNFFSTFATITNYDIQYEEAQLLLIEEIIDLSSTFVKNAREIIEFRILEGFENVAIN
jgi:hypothetical protein